MTRFADDLAAARLDDESTQARIESLSAAKSSAKRVIAPGAGMT